MRDAGGMNGFLDTMNPSAATKSKAAGAGPASKRETEALVSCGAIRSGRLSLDSLSSRKFAIFSGQGFGVFFLMSAQDPGVVMGQLLDLRVSTYYARAHGHAM